MEILLLIVLIISYVLVIKEINYERKNSKEKEAIFIFCQDEETIKKIGEDLVDSGALEKKKILNIEMSVSSDRDYDSARSHESRCKYRIEQAKEPLKEKMM